MGTMPRSEFIFKGAAVMFITRSVYGLGSLDMLYFAFETSILICIHLVSKRGTRLCHCQVWTNDWSFLRIAKLEKRTIRRTMNDSFQSRLIFTPNVKHTCQPNNQLNPHTLTLMALLRFTLRQGNLTVTHDRGHYCVEQKQSLYCYVDPALGHGW